jgi:hypothetical protein
MDTGVFSIMGSDLTHQPSGDGDKDNSKFEWNVSGVKGIRISF